MPVHELLDRMGAHELAEWRVLYRAAPWGDFQPIKPRETSEQAQASANSALLGLMRGNK